MSKINLTMWKAIQEAIVADWEYMYGKKNYEALGDSWGISAGTVHRIIHDNHIPQAGIIQRVLIEAARKKGYLPYPKKRVRIDLPSDADPHNVKQIRTELTAGERYRALMNGLTLKDYTVRKY